MNPKADTELIIFCENIKRLRCDRHLSKSKMAKMLGIGVRTLELIEGGVFPERLNANIIFRVKKHFGIFPKDLFKKP